MSEFTHAEPMPSEEAIHHLHNLDVNSARFVDLGSVAMLEKLRDVCSDSFAVEGGDTHRQRDDHRSPRRPFVPVAPIKPRREIELPGRPSRRKAGRTKPSRG